MSTAPDGVKPEDLADEIMASARFITFMDNDDMWSYEKGVYVEAGEARVKAACEKAVRGTSSHFASEVLAHIKRRTYIQRQDVDLDWYLIAVENGIVDLRDGSFKEHSPDRILVNKLPVKYDEKAKCPAWIRFLASAQPDVDSRTRLMDHFAACLDRRPKKRRALLCIGERDTGKSTFLNVMETFLGQNNVSNVPLQQLCGEDKFAAAQLYGKVANIYADLSTIPLKQLGQFKALTGGDWLSAQAKHKDMFKFRSHVKLLFSANKPPDVKDITDDAFFSRWDPIYWKQQWKPSEQDKNLEAKLTRPEELSGILNILIGYAQRQIRTGRFHFESSPVEVRDLWLSEAEPARNFLKEAATAKMDSLLKRADLFAQWNEWRKPREISHVSETRFNDLVSQMFSAKKVSRKIGGKSTECWLGLGWAGRYRELETRTADGQGLLATAVPESSGGGPATFNDNLWSQGKLYTNEVVTKTAGTADPILEEQVWFGFRKIFGFAPRGSNGGNGHATKSLEEEVVPSPPVKAAEPPQLAKPKSVIPEIVCSVEECGIKLGQSGPGSELSVYKIGKQRFCKKHYEEKKENKGGEQ